VLLMVGGFTTRLQIYMLLMMGRFITRLQLYVLLMMGGVTTRNMYSEQFTEI
jgi:hypothetical protein